MKAERCCWHLKVSNKPLYLVPRTTVYQGAHYSLTDFIVFRICSGLHAGLPFEQPLLQIPEWPHQLGAGRRVCECQHSRSGRARGQRSLQFKCQRGLSDAGDPTFNPHPQPLWGCSSVCWHLDLPPTPPLHIKNKSILPVVLPSIQFMVSLLQQGARKAVIKILKNFDEAITVDVASLDPENLYQRPYAGWVLCVECVFTVKCVNRQKILKK